MKTTIQRRGSLIGMAFLIFFVYLIVGGQATTQFTQGHNLLGTGLALATDFLAVSMIATIVRHVYVEIQTNKPVRFPKITLKLFVCWLLFASMLLFTTMFLANFIPQSENQVLTNNTFAGLSPYALILVSFQTAFVAPVVEEFFFRYMFLTVNHVPRALFIGLASCGTLLFALAHCIPMSITTLLQFAVYLLCSVILTSAYLKTKNIWFSISLHMLNNILSVIILLMAR